MVFSERSKVETKVKEPTGNWQASTDTGTGFRDLRLRSKGMKQRSNYDNLPKSEWRREGQVRDTVGKWGYCRAEGSANYRENKTNGILVCHLQRNFSEKIT